MWGGSGKGSPKFSRRPPPSYVFPGNSNNNEQPQTFFIDPRFASTGSTNNLSTSSINSLEENPENNSKTPRIVNRKNSSTNLKRTFSSCSATGSGSYGGTISNPDDLNKIRFQVVVWNIGRLDIVTSSVPMTFRVSLFWNDISTTDNESNDDNEFDSMSLSSANSVNVWKMAGRQKAFQQELTDLPQRAVEVPPLAILNCSTFEIIGSPDVGMLRESSRLMRWTCMYRATMIQENLRVDRFPHDDHDIFIKLAILSQRGKGQQWDKRIWKLGLATKDDAQGSTRIPHGLIVDQARLPEFSYNKKRGLEFNFSALDHGTHVSHDEYLKVSLNVLRESAYYDKNIVPLLGLMNVVAVSVLTFKDTEFFYRALITLNIAFVEMSIRMTTDSHLPSVGYEIRLQRVLNEFFFVLMCLVLEAMTVYVLRESYNVSNVVTRRIDWTTGIVAICHSILTLGRYYRSKQRAQQRLNYGWKEKPRTRRGSLTKL